MMPNMCMCIHIYIYNLICIHLHAYVNIPYVSMCVIVAVYSRYDLKCQLSHQPAKTWKIRMGQELGPVVLAIALW